MDSARQLVRWALPGWVAALFWIYFAGVSLLIQDQIQQLIFKDDTFISITNSYLLILVVAAIPFGFIIYQIYYWLYWHARTPGIIFRHLMTATDRSFNVLRNITSEVDWEGKFFRSLKPSVDEYPIETAYRKGAFRQKDSEIMLQYQNNWTLAQSLWYLALCDERLSPVAGSLEKRVQFLSDIYHSLGACLIALTISYLAYLAFYEVRHLIADSLWLTRGLAAILNLWVMVLMFSIFRKGRRDSFYALTALMHDFIGLVFSDQPTIKAVRVQKKPESDISLSDTPSSAPHDCSI